MQESVLSYLSHSLGRKDEIPNLELAKRIVVENNLEAIKCLIENLQTKTYQNNCIKVIYEIGEIKPSLISAYAQEFILLLDSANNRMVWGAMSALSRITLLNPHPIYLSIVKLCQTADLGTVITRDQAVNILIKLCSFEAYKEAAFPLLIEQVLSCPSNQLPMYAENALAIITAENKDIFYSTLLSRYTDLEIETKRKRVEKVLRRLNKLNYK